MVTNITLHAICEFSRGSDSLEDRGEEPPTRREGGYHMRKLTVLCGLVALTIGLLTPAHAATPGAFTPAEASGLC